MSCGCSNIDPCGKPFTTTTSTTTTTTVCPDAIECSEVIETSCVIYSGCDDECVQIKTGDSLETVFGNIFEAVSLCPTTTTTTTVNPCPEAICGVTYEGTGYLYNWWAIYGAGAQTNGGRNVGGIVNTTQPYVDERNEWRVPTNSDWNTLSGFIDPTSNYLPSVGTQSTIAGGHLKTKCSAPLNTNNGIWESVNVGATNLYNWSAVPGGLRYSSGGFTFLSGYGYWWSTTENGILNYWVRSILFYNANFFRDLLTTNEGLSIRLVRPATATELLLPDGTTSNDDPSLPHYVGNSRTYITVKIGTQVWTAQNLIDELYNDGTPIPEVTDSGIWVGLTTGARCSYNNSPGPFINGSVVDLCGIPIPR